MLTGTVEAVDEHWDWQTDYFQVTVRVEEVERGRGIKPGDQFVVSCFIWSRPVPGMVGASGHRSIPDIGDTIRLFAWRSGTKYEGNYPDWYDVVAPSPRPWLLRRLDSQKVRGLCGLFGMGLVGIAGWYLWKKRRRLASIDR